jgi:hypothetical protein
LPNASNLSRARAKLDSDPLRMLFEHVASPVGADWAAGVFCQLDLALATFLLKILAPACHLRDRPDRTSPRKTKKAGDFPARRPREPIVVNVTRRLELHCLNPRRFT